LPAHACTTHALAIRIPLLARPLTVAPFSPTLTMRVPEIILREIARSKTPCPFAVDPCNYGAAPARHAGRNSSSVLPKGFGQIIVAPPEDRAPGPCPRLGSPLASQATNDRKTLFVYGRPDQVRSNSLPWIIRQARDRRMIRAGLLSSTSLPSPTLRLGVPGFQKNKKVTLRAKAHPQPACGCGGSSAMTLNWGKKDRRPSGPGQRCPDVGCGGWIGPADGSATAPAAIGIVCR